MFVVALILFLLAAVAVVTGVLGLSGTLPRNHFFGVHTEAALRTEATFRIANRVAAPTSLAAGALLGTAGWVVLVSDGLVAVTVALLAMAIALFTLGAGVTAAERAIAGSAPDRTPGECGHPCGTCALGEVCRSVT